MHQQCILSQTLRFLKGNQDTSRAPNTNKQPCSCQTSLRKWTCSFTSFSASVSTLNQQIFTYFVQRRSFLSSCYHFNLKQAFKENNLVPMTMQHGRCHWSRALWQISGRACSCKKDPCYQYPREFNSPVQPHNEHIWHMKFVIHMQVKKNKTDPGKSLVGLSNLFVFHLEFF